MDIAKARQPRHAFVQAWIVLHGAGAEREQAGVDAIVLLAQAHIVPHGFRLAKAWQSQRGAPGEPALPVGKAWRLLDVDTGGVEAADFEDQAFFDGQRAIAAKGLRRTGNGFSRPRRPTLAVQHSSTSRSALA